jgi:hypothetical protein
MKPVFRFYSTKYFEFFSLPVSVSFFFNRIMFFNKLLLSVIPFAYSTRFPILRTAEHKPMVELLLDNSNVQFELAIDRLSRLHHPDRRDSSIFELSSDNQYSVNITVERTMQPSMLGIGPSSPLVQTFGNIGVFENELVLNISDSEFSSRCVENSTLTIPIQEFENQFYLYNFMSTIELAGELRQSHMSTSKLYNYDYSLVVPLQVYDEVVDALTSAGAEPLTDYSFQNCPLSALSHVPNMFIHLGALVGYISISLADFINVNPEHHVCEFRFRVGPSAPFMTAFSPLHIPGMNVLISRDDELRICDDRTGDSL